MSRLIDDFGNSGINMPQNESKLLFENVTLKKLRVLFHTFGTSCVLFINTLPFLQHLTPVWKTATEYILRPQTILQNKSIQSMHHLHQKYSTDMLYHNFQIMNISSIYLLLLEVISVQTHFGFSFCDYLEFMVHRKTNLTPYFAQ